MLKRYKYLSSALIFSLLIGCNGVGDSDSSGLYDNDTSSGLSGSNDDSSGLSAIHNQGKSCISCHDFNGATVFNNKQAADNTLGVLGYRVRLGDADIYNVSRGTGNSNFYGSATLTKFTAHVIDPNGNIVRSSNTDSHDNTRLDCNSCHTPTNQGRLTP